MREYLIAIIEERLAGLYQDLAECHNKPWIVHTGLRSKESLLRTIEVNESVLYLLREGHRISFYKKDIPGPLIRYRKLRHVSHYS